MTPDRPAILDIAERLLTEELDPVPRYRLLRDVLRLPVDAPDLVAARDALASSRWVRDLERDQHDDGSWGRFHSKDASLERTIETTEQGVERAVALGLDAGHPILESAARYITYVLKGEQVFPDPPEKNTRWPIGTRLFAAATLAMIQTDHPAIADTRAYWASVASRAFRAGGYDPTEELLAHEDLSRSTIKELRYLKLSGKYQLTLLGAHVGSLPRDLEEQLVAWVCADPSGIGYLSVPLSPPPPSATPSVVDRWLSSWELLFRFSCRNAHATRAVGWLWSERNAQGLWDWGVRWTGSRHFPMSESRRIRRRRAVDYATRVLVLLGRLFDQG